MPIFLWIPLSERCKIDLKIILIRWAEHLFWINSTSVQGQPELQCRLGAPTNVSHTLTDGYIYRSTLEVIFIITHHTFSLCIWLVRSSSWRLFFSHTWENIARVFRFWPRVLAQIWPALTLVNTWPNWLKTLPKFWFLQSAFFGTEIEVDRWLWLGYVDFCWLWLDWYRAVWEGCVTHFGWLTILRLC